MWDTHTPTRIRVRHVWAAIRTHLSPAGDSLSRSIAPWSVSSVPWRAVARASVLPLPLLLGASCSSVSGAAGESSGVTDPRLWLWYWLLLRLLAFSSWRSDMVFTWFSARLDLAVVCGLCLRLLRAA